VNELEKRGFSFGNVKKELKEKDIMKENILVKKNFQKFQVLLKLLIV
jgi:hypothetical protein